MKIVIKIILLIGVLGYLIFGIARLSGDEDKRICSGVEIIIKDSIKPNFIDKSFVKELVLQTQRQIEGTAIKDINIKFIEEFIQESPYIDSTIC